MNQKIGAIATMILYGVSLYSMESDYVAMAAKARLDSPEVTDTAEEEILIGKHKLSMKLHIEHSEEERQHAGIFASFENRNTEFGKLHVFECDATRLPPRFTPSARKYAYQLSQSDKSLLKKGFWAYVPRTHKDAGALIIGTSTLDRTAVVEAFEQYRPGEETAESTRAFAADRVARGKGRLYYLCYYLCCRAKAR